MSTMSTTAERAANWWRNKLFVFSISPDTSSSDCPWIQAFVPKSIEKGYKLTPLELENFYNELTEAIISELSVDHAVNLETISGGPVGLLAEVSQAVGIPDDIFPANTKMMVGDDSVSVNNEHSII